MIGIADYLDKQLRDYGIKEDLSILDFGCGQGNYTIPMAQIVGGNGKVYVIDKDKTKLNQLLVIAKKVKVDKTIEILESEGQFDFDLSSESVDLVMLFNVSCCIIGQDNYPEFQKLIHELHRLTKKDGKLIIGIKEGKTMLNRVETGIPLISKEFKLDKKEKGKYLDGEKLRNGIFYSLTKK